MLASPLAMCAGAGLASANEPIASARDAINVFDLMAAAEKKLSAAHFTYIATGVEDSLTVKRNRDSFQLFQIRPRRFVDITTIDTSVEVFGQRYPSPVMLAPTGHQRAFHSEGELATARAAYAKGQQMILSTMTSQPIGDVAREYRQPLWFQLYPSSEWTVAKHLIEKAEASGCTVLAMTADTPANPIREPVARFRRNANEQCKGCHDPNAGLRRRPMFADVDTSMVRGAGHPFTWELIDRIRKLTRMKLVVKGVMTPEDADLCVQRGIDGIIVSNHGGRQEETLLSTIEVLPEIVAVVKRRIPVLIDGGFRRGSDVFKAVGIGATAICIGRPYLWGLGAFGQEGVERSLELMNAELVMTMKMAGTTSLTKITPAHVRRRPDNERLSELPGS